jgi:putative ABC transport system substrate-binding protein
MHFHLWKRREFITLLGGAAAWPLAARAQQPVQTVPTIGYLGPTTHLSERHQVDVFVQQLSKLGWIEGRNIAIEYRWAEGHSQRPAEMAAEFARLKVDVIVTGQPRMSLPRSKRQRLFRSCSWRQTGSAPVLSRR